MDFICIMHIYNEEYLLPFWLNHHKDIFHKIIIIDYNSTDKSIDICKSIIPDCIIINSRNNEFKACDVDFEVMDIENTYQNCFKICLNVTEFLITYGKKKDDCKKLFEKYMNINIMFKLNIFIPVSLKKEEPKNNKELFQRICDDDIKFANNIQTKISIRGHRFLHNYNNGNYSCGRHDSRYQHFETNEFDIIVMYYYPNNDKFMARKMQIKSRIPYSDKINNLGYHHFWSEDYINNLIYENYNNNEHYNLKTLDEKLYNYLLTESINM